MSEATDPTGHLTALAMKWGAPHKTIQATKWIEARCTGATSIARRQSRVLLAALLAYAALLHVLLVGVRLHCAAQ